MGILVPAFDFGAARGRTGEFARLVNHLYGDKPKRDDEKEQNLEEEMGDILYTLMCFANSPRYNPEGLKKFDGSPGL